VSVCRKREVHGRLLQLTAALLTVAFAGISVAGLAQSPAPAKTGLLSPALVSQLAAPQNDIAARPNPSLTESPEQAGARLLQGTLATLNTWAVDPAKIEALLKTQLASLT
jgi:hypothetical protein